MVLLRPSCGALFLFLEPLVPDLVCDVGASLLPKASGKARLHMHMHMHVHVHMPMPMPMHMHMHIHMSRRACRAE